MKNSSQESDAVTKVGGPARLDTTLVKGFSLLSALSTATTAQSIATLSTRLSIGRSNVHRLLNTMVELGFVKKDPATRLYSPTLLIWELGSQVADRNALKSAARSVMLELLDEISETIYLSVLSGTEILYLEQFLTARAAKTKLRAGRRVPAIFPASGKVLLAYQEEPAPLVDRIIATVPQAASLDRDKILPDLSEIRKNGYAISESGWTRGYNSLAVPVIQDDYPVVAALGIGVFPDQYSLKKLAQFAPRLTRGAAEIAAMLSVPIEAQLDQL